MSQPHVQVVLGGTTIPDELEAALRRVGARVSFGPLDVARDGGISQSADALVVIAPEKMREGRAQIQDLLGKVSARPRATLVLERVAGGPRPEHPTTVPVSFGARLSADELAVRIRTMIEMRASLDSLHRESLASEQAAERVATQFRSQLHRASRMQRELLPARLPRCESISFSVVYQPTEYVSGDMYDIRRLDDEHISVALMDAEGHGISAALLTVFIKRALHVRDPRSDGAARLLAPEEVLGRLNSELVESDLSDCSFAAGVYALINTRTRQVTLARGGAPYPILRSADGTTRFVRPDGGLIGVFPEARFATETFQLAPGDTLLLHSDGLDLVSAASTGARAEQRDAGDAVQSSGHPGGGGFVRAYGSNHCRAAGAVGFRVTAPPLSALQRGGGVTMQIGSRAPGHSRAARRTNGVHRARPSQDAAQVPPDEEIITTPWFDCFRREGAGPALEHAKSRHNLLRRVGHPIDDLTILAIHAGPEAMRLSAACVTNAG